MKYEFRVMVKNRRWFTTANELMIAQTTIFPSGRVMVNTYGPIDLMTCEVIKTERGDITIMNEHIPLFSSVERMATEREMKLYQDEVNRQKAESEKSSESDEILRNFIRGTLPPEPKQKAPRSTKSTKS